MTFLESTMRFTCKRESTVEYTTTEVANVVNMKKRDCDESKESISKKSKNGGFTRFMFTIPQELILLILSHVSREDLIQLSSVSKKVRCLLSPYLFAQVKVSWSELILTWSQIRKPVQLDNTELIERLRITTCCSKNEWTFPFAELLKLYNNLKSLELCTSGSTNFFKYSSPGSQLRFLRVHAVKSGSIFNMEHLVPFQQLQKLSLEDFQIEVFEENEGNCPDLFLLELDNCIWRYPFQLENFGRNKISSLTLKYTSQFVISERFKMFLNYPRFRELRHLSISNRQKNPTLTLSVHVVKLIESIPSLRTLQLNGNIYNETLDDFTSEDWKNCVQYASSRDVKIFYSNRFT